MNFAALQFVEPNTESDQRRFCSADAPGDQDNTVFCLLATPGHARRLQEIVGIRLFGPGD